MKSRNGPPDAVRISRRISLAAAAVQALMDGVVLAVDRQDRRRRAGARPSVTSAPAMTSTSLLASAIVLPASIAASTASRPAVPDDAQSTMSTAGCVATAIEPFGAAPTIGAAPAPQAARRRSTPSAVAMRHHARADSARTCSASSAALSPAASADDLQPRRDARRRPPARCGRSIRSSRGWRGASRAGSAGRGRTPASRTAARRCDRARRRGRESATSCPSRRRRA